MGASGEEGTNGTNLPSVTTKAPPPFDGASDRPPPETVVPPPHPLDGTWQLAIDRKIFGPYTGHQIKSFIGEGRVIRSTGVLRAGNTRWRAAADDPVFRDFFPGKVEGSPPPAAGSRMDDRAGRRHDSHRSTNDPGMPWRQPKSLGLAVLLSFIIPGLGQLYNGEGGKAALMLIGTIALWYFWLGWIVWIWSMFDAFYVARAINDRNFSYHSSRWRRS